MASHEDNSSTSFLPFDETSKATRFTRVQNSSEPGEAVVIAFHVGRALSFLCIVFGIIGNTTLIWIIRRSAFRHFSYGLLLVFISTFDSIRLMSSAVYYLIQGHVIPLTLPSMTIYIALYRYPKIVTNWLKVLLAIERFLAVKYWVQHRYNINACNAKKLNRSRQRKLLLIILALLLASLISQHPNLLPNRFSSARISSTRLLIISKPNRNFYYGNHVFSGVLFTIISYIILDDLLPIVTLIVFNTLLLCELRRLPAVTSRKLADSILILFFLTIFSIFVVPRSFLVVFNLYVDQTYVNDTTIGVVFHACQGLEMINHAITGYACFLSCRALRKDLLCQLRAILAIFRPKSPRPECFTLELSTLPRE